MEYLNHLRSQMGYSAAKHFSPYENIKDFVKKDILSRMNNGNDKENVNINNYGSIPINVEAQTHIFITKINNNELNNEKEFNHLEDEEKKSNYIKIPKKGNDLENDDTLNYLRKTKKFIDEISSADTLDYEANTIEINIDKEEGKTNRKISENNKIIKSFADSNIKRDIDFMNNLNQFNFNT